jgi:heme-degrading monooxygenase HmoA
VFVIVWRYWVAPERRERFERAYGPTGDWSILFKRQAGYRGTELVRCSEPGDYLTIDRWDSSESFAQFMTRWQDDYQALDTALDNLTETEQLIGRGTTID